MSNNRNQNFGQPEGDLMPSTESVPARSQEPPAEQLDPPQVFASPEGDKSFSQSGSGTLHGYVAGSGAGERKDGADAFFGESNYVDGYRQHEGPEVERQPFDDQRPLHELHIGTVSSRTQGLKELLRDLLIVAGLTDPEKREVERLGFRKDKINKVIDFWKLKQDPRSVLCLIRLLESAGGANPNKYDDIITQLRQCPP